MRLGKHPARVDKRTIMMSSVIGDVLPEHPPARDWTQKLPLDLGMFANDQVGDCTVASEAHLIQVWSSQSGLIAAPTEDEVLDFYAAISGWNRTDHSTDGGANMIDALNRWRKIGLGDHKIGAFVKVDHTDVDHVCAAINLFGGVYVGAQLPLSAQDAIRSNFAWTGPADHPHGQDTPGSWGGHCMAIATYDRSGVECLTWAKRQPADWWWFLTYVDECYAIIGADWLAADGDSPVGLNVERLNKYLEDL